LWLSSVGLVTLDEVSGEEYSADYWFDKANVSYSSKSYDMALQYIEKSLELNTRNAIAWKLKGNILNYLGKYDEAIECYGHNLLFQ